MQNPPIHNKSGITMSVSPFARFVHPKIAFANETSFPSSAISAAERHNQVARKRRCRQNVETEFGSKIIGSADPTNYSHDNYTQ